jgi:hypothetical protein
MSDQEVRGVSPERLPGGHDVNDMTELLQELRILLPGAQLLTSFLIILPFTQGFSTIVQSEKRVFIATFLCSLASFVLFSAPAAQHRIMRPLRNRTRFKLLATRQMLIGLLTLSLALMFATHLVVFELFGHLLSTIFGGALFLFIAVFWWVLPRCWKKEDQYHDSKA